MALAADLETGITMIPVLKNDSLEVLAFMLEAEPHLVRELGACLTDDERRRAVGLRSDRDRRRFVVTRGQLRHLLASKLGTTPSDIELEYGHAGKPRLSRRMPNPALRFNVSRSEDVAVIALSRMHEVGIDVEALRPVPEADSIAALCFSALEYESYSSLRREDNVEGFFRHWTRLEAIAKTTGRGLGELPSDGRNWAVHTFLFDRRYIGTAVVED